MALVRDIRAAVSALFAAAVLLAGVGCHKGSDPDAGKVLVLGVDGMDPKFILEHFEELPHLKRLAQEGGFVDLRTTIPPQSPVAWSTVITGMSPGGHGVFDFVHRNPDTLSPFSSMAETDPASWVVTLGKLQLPLRGGETRRLREGRAFWDVLAEQDVETTITRMPTEFPPLPTADRALSGMGTPDMLGSFGTFTYYTTDRRESARQEISGGRTYPIRVRRNHVSAQIEGPPNTFIEGNPPVEVPLEIDIDPDNPVARLEVGDELVVLEAGEWSGWVRLDFELIPWLESASGIVRFYLQDVRPHFRLYMSPINIDPVAPEIQISTPEEYASELASEVGRYYTQGMAEETAGLSAHVIHRDTFVQQAHMVLDETIEIYRHQFASFDEGLFFMYFSTIDQAGHMLWGQYEDEMLEFYRTIDDVVGWTLDRIDDDTTLIVMSDHGFQRFDREVHLNRWLMEEGFLRLDDPSNVGDEAGFPHVDWSRTKAYAIGLNAIYINQKGREKRGIVRKRQVQTVKDRLRQALLEFRDPEDDRQIVSRVYDPAEDLAGDAMTFAPDLIVGFHPPYRMSPEAGLGAVNEVVVEDNTDEWIGDHCMAHDQVPGVLFSNRPITAAAPGLEDVAVTVLSLFGVAPPEDMIGSSFFSGASSSTPVGGR